MTHPITPPPELIQRWIEKTEYDVHTWFYASYIAEQAAQWGYEQHEKMLLDAVHSIREKSGWSLEERVTVAICYARQCNEIGSRAAIFEVADWLRVHGGWNQVTVADVLEKELSE